MYDSGGTGQTFTLSLPPPDRRRGRIIALAVVGVVIVVLGVYTMLVFTLGDRVPRGTTVGGVPIGGLSRAAAEQQLREHLLPRASKPIRLRADDETYSVAPADAGLALDVPATVDRAYQPTTFNPVRVVTALVGGDEIAPALDVDGGRLDKTLDKLAAKIDNKAVEGAITFEGGTPKATKPASGRELDRSVASARVRRGFLVTSGTLELPTVEHTPSVDQAEIARAMREFARPAMAGPVALQVGDGSLDVSPAEVGTALRMTGDDSGQLKPSLDGKVLAKTVASKLAAVQVAPKDATIAIVNNKPRIEPSKPGHTVPPDKLSRAVLSVLTKTGGARVARVETVTKEPELTTKALQDLGIRQVVGEYTTYFPHAAYRNTNIGRAAELIDGHLFKPEETFSLNGIVGERTAANGFAKGFVIKGGRLREELGGGVSQVATTTYNAAFFAGMDDVEHRPHGFYIDRYPVGREATVYWGSLDLKWRNNTPHGVYVQAWRELSNPSHKGSVTVRLWSTKYWTVKSDISDRYNVRKPKTIHDPKPGCVEQETGVPGFDVDVRRWLYHGGQQVRAERDHVRYNAEDQVVCGPPPTNPPATKPPTEQPPAVDE